MKKNRSVSQFRATSQPHATRKWSPLSSVVLCAILFLCFIPVTHADGPAFDEPRLFGTGSDGTRRVAVGDVNGDGALDLVTGNQCGHKGCTESGEQNVVYLNDGAGNFSPEAAHSIGPALDYTYGIAVGDFNGDGALDVIVGNLGEQNAVYLNDGTGSFPYTSMYTQTVGTGTDDTMNVAVGDLDGDGALDIVVGNYQSQNAVYLNDGTGSFPYTSTFTRTFGPGDDDARSLAVGDMDGDGHLDIVVGDYGAPNLVYLNNGSGSFPYTSAYTRAFGTGSDYTYSVAVGDMDGDGALDIVAGNSTGQSLVYLNDGDGDFVTSRPFGTASDDTFSVAVGDLNGDGALDIIQGNSGSPDPQNNMVYLNDGNGNFDWAGAALSFGAETDGVAVTAGDINGDGPLDIVVGAGHKQNVVYLNNGSGDLSDVLPFGPDNFNDPTWAVAVGDVDADQDLDVVLGKGDEDQGLPNRVCRNNGQGSLVCSNISAIASKTRSIALGDVDGDGHLDVVTGNDATSNRIYANDGTGSFSHLLNFGYGTAYSVTYGIALGDVNGDGPLDIIVGNAGQNMVFLNDSDGTGGFYTGSVDCSAPPASVRCFGSGSDTTHSVALGDLDGDGDLDIVAGNGSYAAGEQNMIYLNDGAGGFTERSFGTDTGRTLSIALGDMNGDGNLDIITGNGKWPGQKNMVFLNDGSGAFPASSLLGMEQNYTYGLALGDIDGDGDLDVVAANGGIYGDEQSWVYLNDGSGTFGWATPTRRMGTGADAAYGVAVGDLSGDGTLDAILGNVAQDEVYLNGIRQTTGLVNNPPSISAVRPGPTANGNLFSTPAILESTSIPITYTLYDLEGDLVGHVAAYYSPDGGGRWLPAIPTSDTVTSNIPISRTIFFEGFENTGNSVYTSSVSALSGAPNIGYQNSSPNGRLRTQAGPGFYKSGTHAATLDRNPSGADQTNYLIVTVDMSSHDASIDPVVLDFSFMNHGEESHPGDRVWIRGSTADPFIEIVDLNVRQGAPGVYVTLKDIDISRWLRINGQNFGSTFQIWFGQEDNFPATSTTGSDGYTFDDITLRLAPWRSEEVYTWDTFASGFFGQSDNVVLRFLAHSRPAMNAAPGTYRYTDTVPGPYHWPYASAMTFPFRARGTQIRVVSGTLPVPGAIVYRLPAGELTGGALMASGAGTPFRTDEQGYLQGRGEIFPGDHLMAMLPISATDSYTVYFTSGSPTLIGLDAYTVTSGGVQTLTISSDIPLILFNLDFSIEWDAHNDAAYLEQLYFYLQRASEYLYDFSNGQVALGDINVFQNADEWVFSHVVVRANNRLRPFAIQGGIVSTDTIDPHHNSPTDTIRYSPGQVTMGSVWNRYGNPGQSLGEDWPIILAHELSHFLLFHDDVYLGMDDSGNLISVDTCQGSAMGDLYDRPDNTEFIADETYWQTYCHNTLAEQTLGRNEWETMQLWYQWLISPTTINPGPSIMPFDFTHVLIHDPYTPTDTLVDPTFYIDYDGGGASSSEARAYLLRDQYLVNLGSPFGGQNRVIARGAQAGDRLCVFDRPSAQFGCESIEPGDDRLAMRQDTGWNPIITLTPINSTTFAVNLTNPVSITFPLRARIFPDLGYAPDPITLSLSGDEYSGTFSLSSPTLSGNLQVWVEEPATETFPRRESIVAYTIGGNPGMFRGAGGMFRGAGGMFRGAGGMFRGAGGMFRGAGAPILSADGQMIFFTENPIDFITGTLFAIQGMAGLPPLPPGRTLIGQGYNLLASPGYTLPVGSVSIQYLSNDVLVAGASESDLALYFWNGGSWSTLDTILDTYYNLASAPSQGEGVYALMASIKIPLHGPGWNNFAYAAQGSQPITQALLSISGLYTTVYGYESTDTFDPWRVYDVTVDDWVNSLRRLEFGQGYWINVSQSITLHLQSALPSVTSDQVAPLDEPDMLFPPSTFYGTLLPQNGFTPTVGVTLTARVLPGDIPCGRTRTREVDGQVVYVVDVFADGGPGSPTYGCGVSGRTVRFDLSGLPLFPVDTWDNRRLWHLDLSLASSTAYLPLVLK
jgi:hypothetical protein